MNLTNYDLCLDLDTAAGEGTSSRDPPAERR